KYPAAARALVEFLTSESSQLKMFTDAGYLLPSRKAALDSATVKNAPLNGALATQLQRARGPLWSYGPDPKLSVYTGDNYDSLPVTSVVSGGMSVTEAVTQWASKTAAVL
ncbi:MAG: extracellular solute-binding protein, partial [Candidatus Dormiibacterota bacterium]